jgi:hypothetical protein
MFVDFLIIERPQRKKVAHEFHKLEALLGYKYYVYL